MCLGCLRGTERPVCLEWREGESEGVIGASVRRVKGGQIR